MKLNDLDLNKLHVFRVVAEAGSMRGAAPLLLRSPSAISQSISGLEEALGLRLFRRVGIRLELTEPGRRLLAQIGSNEEALGRLLGELQGAEGQVKGLVTLGLPTGYPAAPLGEALAQALSRYPELQLRLRFLSHAELADSLLRGQLDLALSLQPLRARQRGLRSYEQRREHLILALPPHLRHIAGGGFPVVDYFQKPLFIENWFRHHRLPRSRQKARVRAYGATLEHVLDFLRRGLGAAVVPRQFVAEEIEQGRLFEHPLDKRNPWLAPVWLNCVKSAEALSEGAKVVWQGLS
jgi:DNA-binding transcriptional LysR family regulator